MFDSTDTLSAVSGDGSVREAAVEAPAPTFYIGDTPILKGIKMENIILNYIIFANKYIKFVPLSFFRGEKGGPRG